MAGAMLVSAANQASAAMIAAPVTSALAQLQEWNLVTFDGFTASSEVEGRVFVGGDYTGVKGQQFNFKGSNSKNGTGAITVVGNASGDKIDVQSGDFVVGGNSTVNTLEMHGNDVYAGGTVKAKNANNVTPVTGLASSNDDFTKTLNAQKESLVASLTSLSSNLQALTDTAKIDYTYNNSVTYSAAKGFNVISTSIEDLQKYAKNEIDIYSPNGTTTIINVSGTGGTISKNFNYHDSSSNIIWNFYEATNLTLGNWQGTVLATNADFVKDSSGNLQGTVVAKSASINGELHNYAFQGDLSSVGDSASAMPEPTTWAMMILGFGLIGHSLRRRDTGNRVARA